MGVEYRMAKDSASTYCRDVFSLLLLFVDEKLDVALIMRMQSTVVNMEAKVGCVDCGVVREVSTYVQARAYNERGIVRWGVG